MRTFLTNKPQVTGNNDEFSELCIGYVMQLQPGVSIRASVNLKVTIFEAYDCQALINVTVMLKVSSSVMSLDRVTAICWNNLFQINVLISYKAKNLINALGVYLIFALLRGC